MKPDFESLYEAYYDKVFRYAYSILLNRENAEDVTAETFFAAYAAYQRYDPHTASPATWLTRIAHNKAVDFVKSAAFRKTEPLDGSYDAAAADDTADLLETQDMKLRLYARLTKAEREFLDLRYVMELSDGEIAALYNLPVKTVNKRYQRLLTRCRKILEEDEKILPERKTLPPFGVEIW